MYLWKYWRESRVVFLGYLGLILFGFALTALHPVKPEDPSSGYLKTSSMLLFLDVLLMAVLSVYFGGLGIGRALGEGAGAFLLTRPQKRAAFVWNDWGAGMALLLTMVVATNMWSGFLMYRALQTGNVHINNQAASLTLPAMVTLNTLAVALICALIFSIVYLCTVLLKKERGNVLGIAVIVGYLILGGVLSHYGIGHLPSLLLNPYNFMHDPATHSVMMDLSHVQHGVWLSALLRIAVLLLFPIAAQLRLDRTEIAR